jgi:hypothetical protein
MIVPSFYLAYNLYNEKKFTKTAEQFVQKEFENNGYTVIYKKINYNSNPRTIDLAFLNKKFTDKEINSFNKMLADNGLAGTRLTIRQNDTDIKSEILSEINKFDSNISEKDITISKLRQELDTYRTSDSTLLKEIEILYPKINNVSYGKIEKFPQTDSAQLMFTLLYSGDGIDQDQLARWLQKRINEKNISIKKRM